MNLWLLHNFRVQVSFNLTGRVKVYISHTPEQTGQTFRKKEDTFGYCPELFPPCTISIVQFIGKGGC